MREKNQTGDRHVRTIILKSVMQEKIWGGTKLRDEFGYDIPSEKIGEYWASQPIQMESLRSPMDATREQT